MTSGPGNRDRSVAEGMSSARHTQPRRIDVVGLGPAGPEYVTQSARDLMTGAERLFIRTTRHPAAV
ncbi:MAG TPA: hypothetical protein VHZ02_16380, partial [Acidimicrobiales bacterium]|nr:hypothetical protein [Acidimicrobiales bacterium]